MLKKVFNWVRLRNLEHSLDRELEYHIDRRVSDLVRSGVTEKQARKQAGHEIGGGTQVREEVLDIWLTRWLRDFAYDVRYSARTFRRSPSFTATAVLSLALGIGATTAIYSLVDQVILHALPVHDPQRLVLIDWTGERVYGGFGSYNLMSYPLCRDLQKQEQFFEGVLCRAAVSIQPLDRRSARDRDSSGAGGHAVLHRMAGGSRCIGDDRGRSCDRVAMRVGAGPPC